MKTKNKKVENINELTEEQTKALESVKADLLSLVALEQMFEKETDEDKKGDIGLNLRDRNELLTKNTIKFYALSTTDTLQLISMATLGEKVLNFIEKGNYLENYIFNLLKDRLTIKHRLISKATRPLKQEVVYEIDFSKLQK